MARVVELQTTWDFSSSVYMVAESVPASETANFVGYTLQVYQAIRNHHHEEEAFVFLSIEAATKRCVMQANVDQHGKKL